ncbi:glycoside hydrolase family 97 C-terminal domain-containing protein [Paraflavitalea speifideaquila]|uniref:glycoside hydrolase family 97 C-terminal domain-containing protein n=1 Tax=Paraflavitalea speifideaquila TaxID=3076558 RepID=UPI0033130267
MAADLPENYAAKPDAFQFIKDVPVDWDDTKIVEAEPGDYISIARKEKGGRNWYIGTITDENSRTSVLPLSFLDKGQPYIAVIYGDAPGGRLEVESRSVQDRDLPGRQQQYIEVETGSRWRRGYTVEAGQPYRSETI